MSCISRISLVKLLQPFACKASVKFSTTAASVDNVANTSYNPPEIEPIISTKRYLDDDKFYIKPRQAWIENLDTIEEKKLGLMTLHPDIFGAQPRVDVIHENVRWQQLYRYVVS